MKSLIKIKMAVAMFAVGLPVAVEPLLAHHNTSAYIDYNRTIPITGVITKITWANPHVQIYVNVKDANGRITSWNLGMAPPNALKRAGFDQSVLKVNETVTLEVWGPKEGKADAFGDLRAEAKTLTLADGRKLDFGGPPLNQWMQPPR
jgi:hypothetical protein